MTSTHLSFRPPPSRVDMHRALDIPEILSRIVGAMDVAKPGDLLPLTRVSRAFSEPALDKLWEAPPLWDLAVLMNAHIWHEDLVKHMGNGLLGSIMVTDHIMVSPNLCLACFGSRRSWMIEAHEQYD
jgi:hypothetical protein